MRYFPQLASGSMAQYPLLREQRRRTIVSESPDGYRTKLGDPDAASLAWELTATGLCDEELSAIQDLFQECEGRLKCFTFLDPADNLLVESETLTETVWQKGPLVDLTEGVADPMGTGRATRIHNGSQTAQSVAQALPVPGSLVYAFSVYARSSQATAMTLKAAGEAASASKTFTLMSDWRRCVFPVQLGSTDEAVSFGIEIPSGASADVFGLQVEASPGVTEYKRTAQQAGVHSQARFAADSLSATTDGPDRHGVVVRILSARRD